MAFDPLNIAVRLTRLDWKALNESLRVQGFAVTGSVLTEQECLTLSNGYDDESRYRSRVVMARHGFGLGEYKYFSYPLPNLIAQLRTELYPHLVGQANAWQEAMGLDTRFPASLEDMLARCHAAGQVRATPLLLK